MAKQYVVTEAEMLSLFDQLKLEECTRDDEHGLPPDAINRLRELHRKFHYVTVRWAQSIGFDGYRK